MALYLEQEAEEKRRCKLHFVRGGEKESKSWIWKRRNLRLQFKGKGPLLNDTKYGLKTEGPDVMELFC